MIVKTSSLGDVIHTLPALTDAKQAIPDIIFDWVIEEKLQAIPAWHPAVDRVIPIALRQWKKNKVKQSKQFFFALSRLKKILNEVPYDLVIDAQGLLKSAVITRLVKAPSAGYQRHCIREKLASFFYKINYDVAWRQHAIERIRDLFSQALYYPRLSTMANYGLDNTMFSSSQTKENSLVFFHGTTWKNKEWPESYWKQLIMLAKAHHFSVKLAWGNEEEYQRSQRLAHETQAEILPYLDVPGLMSVLVTASAVVGVDTGFCHLSAALNIPTLVLFGPTDPEKTGVMGDKQLNLRASFACAPCLKKGCRYQGPAEVEPACFQSLPPWLVMKQLKEITAS